MKITHFVHLMRTVDFIEGSKASISLDSCDTDPLKWFLPVQLIRPRNLSVEVVCQASDYRPHWPFQSWSPLPSCPSARASSPPELFLRSQQGWSAMCPKEKSSRARLLVCRDGRCSFSLFPVPPTWQVQLMFFLYLCMVSGLVQTSEIRWIKQKCLAIWKWACLGQISLVCFLANEDSWIRIWALVWTSTQCSISHITISYKNWPPQ